MCKLCSFFSNKIKTREISAMLKLGIFKVSTNEKIFQQAHKNLENAKKSNHV